MGAGSGASLRSRAGLVGLPRTFAPASGSTPEGIPSRNYQGRKRRRSGLRLCWHSPSTDGCSESLFLTIQRKKRMLDLGPEFVVSARVETGQSIAELARCCLSPRGQIDPWLDFFGKVRAVLLRAELESNAHLVRAAHIGQSPMQHFNASRRIPFSTQTN